MNWLTVSFTVCYNHICQRIVFLTDIKRYIKQFEERLEAKNKKAAEMAEMEAEMKKRLEAKAQEKAMMVETNDNVEESSYDKNAARERAANRRRKAPRRGFVSREKTPADFDQPIRVH